MIIDSNIDVFRPKEVIDLMMGLISGGVIDQMMGLISGGVIDQMMGLIMIVIEFTQILPSFQQLS